MSTLRFVLFMVFCRGLIRAFRLSSPSRRCAFPLAMTFPPVARRDEDRVIYAGAAGEGRQTAGSTEPLLDPPVAVPDPYGWIRDDDRTDEQVLSHLTAENEYTQALTRHLEPLREQLYREMLNSIQETDYTVPRPGDEKWVYYSRTYQGQSYPVYCRAPRSATTTIEWDGTASTPILTNEEVVLDVNALAKDKPYCDTGSIETSPSHTLLAYAVDFTGNEKCALHVQNLASGQLMNQDPDLEIYGSLVWGKDDSTLFYLKMDATQRPYQVFRRTLDSSEPDELLFQDLDGLYWVGISKSLDNKYLFIESASKETSEIHYLDLEHSQATLECIAPRRNKVLYDVEHRKGYWWIWTNLGHDETPTPNMRLMRAPVQPKNAEWQNVTLHDQVLFDGGYQRSLADITCFRTHVVAEGREGGIPRVWILSLDDQTDQVVSMERLEFDEPAHDVGLAAHYEFDATTMLVSYESMVTPPSFIEISFSNTLDRRIVKTKAVPGYDPSLYACERITVPSRDGSVEIPVSIVYRKDVMEQFISRHKPVHVHLYGYGSYGACMESDFRATRLTLLNRGMVFVMAHIRGGGEMGRQWYEEPNGAKYLCKQNTFNDFVDVAKWLIHDKKLTTPDLLSCEGRSAGGLLIGATLNQAPHLFKAAILGVPFVDVVATMVDPSIPLTIEEWLEWGNPNEAKYFQYMMQYSPMQNVQAGAKYPSCLLTGGLHDPRVQYWEPTKFAAELRHLQGPDSGPVCVKMDMSAGHFSASDRYKYLKELAFDYAFLLDQVGLADVKTTSE